MKIEDDPHSTIKDHKNHNNVPFFQIRNLSPAVILLFLMLLPNRIETDANSYARSPKQF